MRPGEILATTPFFAETLDKAQLDALGDRAILAEWPKGAHLIREDDSGSSMFVLVSGEVDVTTGDRNNQSHVATLGPGAILGEMSLLAGARRSATVTARTPVTALEIAKTAVEPLLAASPALVDRFAETLKRRQAELDRLYGPKRGVFGLPRGELVDLIRGIFGKSEPTPDASIAASLGRASPGATSAASPRMPPNRRTFFSAWSFEMSEKRWSRNGLRKRSMTVSR